MVGLHRSSLLRRVLLTDALVSGATGLLMLSGATLLTRLLALPEPLLRYAGLVLMPTLRSSPTSRRASASTAPQSGRSSVSTCCGRSTASCCS